MHGGIFNKRSAKPKMTVADIVDSVAKSLELRAAELKLAEVRERRAELQERIAETSGRLGKETGPELNKVTRTVHRLHEERAELEEAIDAARQARDLAIEPWRRQVLEAVAPILRRDAEHTLAAGEEFLDGCERFANIALAFPWLLDKTVVPVSTPALASWRFCFKRLLDPGCME
jgi:DNA-binding transcriptional MerR regulator